MRWVVAYDVVDDRRRNRVLKILRNYGGGSVQKSVVEGEWDSAEWEAVYHRVRQVVNRAEDTVLFYRQCAECHPKRVELGRPPVRQQLLTVVDVTTQPRGRGPRRTPTEEASDNPFGDP